jgi:hypothetical protein
MISGSSAGVRWLHPAFRRGRSQERFFPMAIQFRCPGCAQPIEVDDVHAGQTATCPYCRRVVNVPAETVLDEPPVTARPAAEGGTGDAVAASESADSHESGAMPVPPTPGGLHVGPTLTHRERLARTYGNWGLVCTGITLALMASSMIYSITVFSDMLTADTASQPSLEEMSEQVVKHPWLVAGPLASMLFAVVGLALGITSVKQTTRGNWRGIVALVICGLFVLCFCGINGMTLLRGGMGGLP